MSARLIAELRCDHLDCDAVFRWRDAHVTWKPPQLGKARAAARVEGWRHGVRLRRDQGPAPSFDFCPEHAADVEQFYQPNLNEVPQ